jgi:chromosomal replication initiator protein
LFDGVLQLDLPGGDVLGRIASSPSPFVVGPENRLLVPPLQRLLQSDDLAEAARLFNPLVLVGPSGSGKSELAMAIVRHWRAVLQHSEKAASIEYFTAADFGRGCQTAAAEERLAEWRTSVRSLRLLVIEDLQRLRQRDTIQRELRNAIDAILEAGGMIVATTDREPVALSQLDHSLRDRLAAGLIVRIQRPGPAAREAILKAAARSRGIEACDDQFHRLAHREAASANELLGMVRQLSPSGAFSLAESAGLCAETETTAADGRKPADVKTIQRPGIALRQIIAVTARYFSITQAALSGPSRRTTLVLARNIVVHFARCLTDLSYAEIGRALGGRDHTTAMHADRRLAEQIGSDARIQQIVEELERLLG